MGSRARLTAVLVASLVPAGEAAAAEWQLVLDQRVLHRRLPEDVLFAQLRFPTTATLAEALTAYQGALWGELELRPADALGVTLGIDTGLIEIGGGQVRANGAPIGQAFKETLFLGRVFAELQIGSTGVVAVRAGKLVSDVGNRAVFEGYSLGISADADLSLIEPTNPWLFRLEALLPDATFTSRGKNSPLVHGEVIHRVFEDAELFTFGALFIDGKNGLSPLLADAVFRGRLNEIRAAVPRLRPVVQLAALRVAGELQRAYAAGLTGFDVQTSGLLGWAGLGFRYQGAWWRFFAQGILGLGSVRAQIAPQSSLTTVLELLRGRLADDAIDAFLRSSDDRVGISSGMLDVSSDVDLLPWLSAGGFLLVVTGDTGFGQTSRSERYHGFISLAPRMSHTSIFFNGGVSTTLASPTVASIAPDGAGLLALGARLGLRPDPALLVTITGAVMGATHGANTAGGKTYGWELDVGGDLQIADFLVFQLDGGLFFPGSYYGNLPAGGQLIAGFAVFLDG